jgi:type IV secretory pathway VirJ component
MCASFSNPAAARPDVVAAALALFTMVATATPASTPTPAEIVIMHGHPQRVHHYGSPAGRPVIVASGDGGWIHLAPHLAEQLAAHGWFVTGFDAKAYLASGTTGGHELSVRDVQRDFGMLIALADESHRPPLLIGVSEGAGLAIAAAADPRIRDHIAGVVAVGLTDTNELGWRWRDSLIYLTKGVPNEPAFHAADFIAQVSPAPLALLWSTHDEFVGERDQKRLAALARTPTRVLTVKASDHRFSDNLRQLDTTLMDVVDWISRFTDR